jgi:hypothetical protein
VKTRFQVFAFKFLNWYRYCEDEGEFGGFNADIYCVVNISCIELPSAERFVNEKAEGKPVVGLYKLCTSAESS